MQCTRITLRNSTKKLLPDIGPPFQTGTRSDSCACKNTHINKRHSNLSASRDRSEFLKLLFKRQTTLELFFFWRLNYSKYGTLSHHFTLGSTLHTKNVQRSDNCGHAPSSYGYAITKSISRCMLCAGQLWQVNCACSAEDL